MSDDSDLDLSSLKQTPAQRAAMRKKNAAFDRLSKTNQRVKIAEDVLKMLRLKKITASSTYLDLSRDEWSSNPVDTEIPESCELAYALEESGLECRVCGIGSLFVAAVSNHNHITVKKFDDLMDKRAPGKYANQGVRGAEVQYLKKWFSSEQLDLVEDYFEANAETYDWADAWGVLDPDERLRLIMRNIVGNKGVFDPTKGPGKSKFPQPTSDEDEGWY